MTREEQLLLTDLCGRLPHGVECELSNSKAKIVEKLGLGGLSGFMDGTISVKPYLRPMSSMTEEEEIAYLNLEGAARIVDWLNKKMFDHRGLIPKGLAIEAPEGMYK